MRKFGPKAKDHVKMSTETDRIEELERALAVKQKELDNLRFAPVCRKCGEALTTCELICDDCRVESVA